MAKLTVLINDRPSRTFRVVKKLTVGRDAANDVQVLDQKVSRRHFSIEKSKGFFILKDLGSRNGTFLNDVRVDKSELKTGDRIRIGNTTLVFDEDPYIDNSEELETGDLKLPETEIKDPVEYQYDPYKLKSLTEKLTQNQDLKRVITQLTELLAFSGFSRPLESESLIYQGIQDIVHEMIPVDRSYILQRDSRTGGFETMAVRATGRSANEPDFSKPVFRKVYVQGLSLMSHSAFEKSTNHNAGAFDSIARSAMTAPIRFGSKILGMIYVDSTGRAQHFSEENLVILSAIGALAGVQIDTLKKIQEQQQRLVSTLSVFADLVNNDTSSNNSNMEKRMAHRSRLIAETMGLPEDHLEIITVSAFLAGRLCKYSAVQDITETLPENQISNNLEIAIVNHINNQPGMTEISRIVKHRMENFDGSGFPEGLSGNAIPMGSRILRAVLLVEDLKESEPEIVLKNVKAFSGSIIDPIVFRTMKQVSIPETSSFWQSIDATCNGNTFS